MLKNLPNTRPSGAAHKDGTWETQNPILEWQFDSPFLVQIPVHSQKTAGVGPNTWILTAHMKHCWSSWLRTSSWLKLSCYRYLGGKLSRALTAAPPASHSAFQVNRIRKSLAFHKRFCDAIYSTDAFKNLLCLPQFYFATQLKHSLSFP